MEKWIYGGDGLSRVDGRVVLTPFVLPGEIIRVEPAEEKRDLVRSRLIDVVAASAERAEPPCPYFGPCGGCQYQHATYEFQARQKSEILREQLRRVGKIEFEGEIPVITGPPLAYRNRSQFHIERGKIGYFADGTHQLVPIDYCPISSPRINSGLAALVRMTRDRRFPEFIKVIELFTNEVDTVVNVLQSDRPVARHFFAWCAEQIPGSGAGFLDYSVGGDVFQVSHNSFFQVNRFLLNELVACAMTDAASETALDLYAGVGLFSVALARRFRKVIAVESSASAVRDLEINARRAGVDIAAVRSNVEQFLPRMVETPSLVLADPPRSGLGKKVTAELCRLRPPRIVVVACDPATLARDAASLAAGGYQIAAMKMIDLFPQTYHLEAIAQFVRESGSDKTIL